MEKIELYHRLSDIECAAVRRLIGELDMKSEIDFRNVDMDEVAADFRARGGQRVPALWDGDSLISGRREIEEFLKWMMDEPFPELARDFDRIAAQTWKDVEALIPPEMRKYVDRLQFLIFDEPTTNILAELPKELAAHPDELCGLHVGTPLTESSLIWPEIDPVRVYLFRWAHLNLLYPDDANPELILREEIAITILHEIGHYFGLSEQDLDRLGYA